MRDAGGGAEQNFVSLVARAREGRPDCAYLFEIFVLTAGDLALLSTAERTTRCFALLCTLFAHAICTRHVRCRCRFRRLCPLCRLHSNPIRSFYRHTCNCAPFAMHHLVFIRRLRALAISALRSVRQQACAPCARVT